MGYLGKGYPFNSDWIKDGWICVRPNAWIPTYAADKVSGTEPALVYTPYPSNRKYYRVCQDDELPISLDERSSDDEKGVPAVFRFRPWKAIKLTRELQEFWFELNRTGFTSDRAAWDGYTDAAFCNEGKMRESKNYINSDGSGAELPKMSRLLFARNLVCGVEMISPGVEVTGFKHGIPVLKLETINPNSLPTEELTYQTHPHLIHHANIILPSEYNGLRRVNPFPHLGGRIGYSVLYPLMASEDVYYDLRMLVPMAVGETPQSPFNPAW